MSKKGQDLTGFTRPSDLSGSPVAAAATDPSGAHARGPALDEAVRPELPAPMRIAFKGGELVELTKDQHYADLVVVRAGERGKTICPSSQAAHWVVLFPRIGSETRVVPEWRLRRVEGAGGGGH